jgi:hypothetical protein
VTPKQVLRSHIQGMHRRHPAQSWTMAQMAEWHALQHHRYSPGHFHEGENRGPGQRPPGWRTGEGAVPRG